MVNPSTFIRRALVTAAVLLASSAALGFSQSASSGSTGHPSEPGVLVVSVQAGSPAEKAGITRGDIILDINGAAVNTQRDLREAILPHTQGDSVSVTLRHGDAQKTLSVALEQRNGRAYLGVLLFPEGRRLGMSGPGAGLPWDVAQGAFVARVASGGPADKAGIRRGDVILSVDGVPVDAEHSLSSLIQDRNVGDTVTLSVRAFGHSKDATPRDLKVTLGSTPDKKKAWLGVEYRTGFPAAVVAPEAPALPGPDMPRAPAPVL